MANPCYVDEQTCLIIHRGGCGECPVSHTPGPWVLGIFGAVNGGPFLEYANGKAQSQIASATVGNGITPGEREANARLIAAAPALLDALRNLSEWAEIYKQSHMADCDCELCGSIQQADAAIQLAKGE